MVHILRGQIARTRCSRPSERCGQSSPQAEYSMVLLIITRRITNARPPAAYAANMLRGELKNPNTSESAPRGCEQERGAERKLDFWQAAEQAAERKVDFWQAAERKSLWMWLSNLDTGDNDNGGWIDRACGHIEATMAQVLSAGGNSYFSFCYSWYARTKAVNAKVVYFHADGFDHKGLMDYW